MSGVAAAAIDTPIAEPPRTFRIGSIGAGEIVRGSHLPAYQARGWPVTAIAASSERSAAAVARRFGIPVATGDWREILSRADVDVVDVSLPPHLHPEVCRAAFAAGKHVLVQKPIALDLPTATAVVAAAREAGVQLAVNQNGRWDPSIRAARTLIESGVFGDLVTASMILRTRQPWQRFWNDPRYSRLMLIGMSIHHIDQFRYLFGEPEEVTAVTARYPAQPWNAESIAIYTLRYASGMIAHAFDDGFPWTRDWSVRWRIEGTGAIAEGDIGWPREGFSTMRYTTAQAPDDWASPTFTSKWFPDAFAGTMGELFTMIATGNDSAISGANNLGTMRIVEACYLSAAQKRTVTLAEVTA